MNRFIRPSSVSQAFACVRACVCLMPTRACVVHAGRLRACRVTSTAVRMIGSAGSGGAVLVARTRSSSEPRVV